MPYAAATSLAMPSMDKTIAPVRGDIHVEDVVVDLKDVAQFPTDRNISGRTKMPLPFVRQPQTPFRTEHAMPIRCLSASAFRW